MIEIEIGTARGVTLADVTNEMNEVRVEGSGTTVTEIERGNVVIDMNEAQVAEATRRIGTETLDVVGARKSLEQTQRDTGIDDHGTTRNLTLSP